MLRCDRAGLDDLLDAQALLVVCPEMLGGMSGKMKDFFDRTYYGALGKISGRPFIAIVAAGSDGEPTARQLARITSGWRLREAAPTLIVCTHAQTEASIQANKTVEASALARARELGATLASGLAIGMW